MTGGSFVLDLPDGVPAVWGQESDVLWAEGEPLLIVGPPGLGKTTLAQQIVLRRAGVLDGPLLGLPVAPSARRTLYLAADRPRQAARSMARMVGERHRQALDDRLIFWAGPLPFDLGSEPERLAAMAASYDAGTVAIDSLKDVAPGLEKPEVGSAVNFALQHLLAQDVEVLALHHQRKATSDGKRPTTLADVYGSTWLTAGAGSVVLLWGDAGDRAVQLAHLKQPADLVGPYDLIHDHDAGVTTRLDRPDPLVILTAASGGITARMLAVQLTGSSEPGRVDVERARRHLERLVGRSLATKVEGDRGTQTAALYLPAEVTP